MAQDLAPVPYKVPLLDRLGLPTQVWSEWLRQLRNQVLGLRIAAVTAAYTASLSDDVILCNATSGAFTVTLPAADARKGKVFTVKKTDSSGNAVTLDGDGSETIDGSTTQSLSSQYDALIVMSDGSGWVILGDR